MLDLPVSQLALVIRYLRSMDAQQIDNAYVAFADIVNMNIARERPSHRVLEFLAVKKVIRTDGLM
jgi:hypothetical protein